VARYFFAVVPPEPTGSIIEAFRARWGHPHHNVEPHITVRPPFTWPEDPERILSPVRAACAGLSPLQARLGAPGRFAGGVLFLSVDSPGLTLLHRAVLQALDPLIPVEANRHAGGGYTPHLTLAVTRFGIDRDGLDRMEAEARNELSDLAPFTAAALRCYRRTGKDDRWEPWCDLFFGGL